VLFILLFVVDSFVCSDLEPSVGKGIALGDVDPATLLPMNDINPSFAPRGLRSHVLVSRETNWRDKVKSTVQGEAPEGSILSFFGLSWFSFITINFGLIDMQVETP
jgi:hypothetical protein